MLGYLFPRCGALKIEPAAISLEYGILTYRSSVILRHAFGIGVKGCGQIGTRFLPKPSGWTKLWRLTATPIARICESAFEAGARRRSEDFTRNGRAPSGAPLLGRNLRQASRGETEFHEGEVVSREFGETFPPANFVDLDRYEVLVKLMENGANLEPFRARTLAPIEHRAGKREKLIARSREKYAASRAEVEDKINRWLKRDDLRMRVGKGRISFLPVNL